MNYFTYDEITKRLVRAKTAIEVERGIKFNPTSSDYAKIGAYPRGTDEVPTPPEGKVAVNDGFELKDGKWVSKYRFDDVPPTRPRSFSKRKLYNAFKSRGLWDSVVSYMESAGVWEDWEYSTTLDEDDELMTAAIEALSAQIGAATMEAILSEGDAE